jgi:6-phosphogluconate dehydrogenase
MGKSLALNFVNKGFGVAVYNIPMPGEEQVVRNFVQKNDAQNFFGGDSILDFLNHLKSPRKVLLMVKSGAPVDSVIQKLIPHLNKGDIIIDGGNSFFKDTIRREKELSNVGIHYVGMGVSGGEKGALLGPSMMPAGSQEIKNELMPLFEKVAAQKDGEPCVAWVGENGAGHFVKMVHNGIEYADMQILSEYYSILKNICGLSNEAIADFMAEGKETLQDSYLLDITVKILRHKENGKPTLDQILDVAGHKGTGLWTVKEALDLGVPIPSISTAMNARILSGQKPLRERLAQNRPDTIIKEADKNLIKTQLSDAILTARLLALAEGFHLMNVASTKYDWNLNLSEIAKIWRAGCIIRSEMLPLISTVFEEEKYIDHLLESPKFRETIHTESRSLEISCGILSNYWVPTPCLFAALQYYKSMHESYSAINMIQAQRDFFGAHGYQKLDGGSVPFHTNWESFQ